MFVQKRVANFISFLRLMVISAAIGPFKYERIIKAL